MTLKYVRLFVFVVIVNEEILAVCEEECFFTANQNFKSKKLSIVPYMYSAFTKQIKIGIVHGFSCFNRCVEVFIGNVEMKKI